jgi:hypothetical protein
MTHLLGDLRAIWFPIRLPKRPLRGVMLPDFSSSLAPLPGESMPHTGQSAQFHPLHSFTRAEEVGLASLSALGTLGLSVALVAVFVSIEARTKHLLVPLGVSRTRLLPGDQAIPGRTRPRGRPAAGTPFQQVGVLRAAAPCRSDHSADRKPRGETSAWPVARAGLHAMGRAVQSGARRCHSFRPPRRALPDPARGRSRPRRVRHRKGGRPKLVGAVVGDRASVGIRTRVPELPRP